MKSTIFFGKRLPLKSYADTNKDLAIDEVLTALENNEKIESFVSNMINDGYDMTVFFGGSEK